MKKAFLLIRTKIDVDCMRKKNKSQVKEEELLIKIKDYIIEQTSHLSGSEEDVFLISSYDPYKWDFFRLIEAIINMMPDPEMDPTSYLTEQYMADARIYIKENGVSGIEEFLREKLQRMKDVKIRFGITGDSGTGKSAFINAIRGLKDDDDGAAEVGVAETTKEPIEYQHPGNPMISFVDLPGIGTPNYPDRPTYCEKVGLKDYDTFLIFTAGRFTQHDLELAKKVKSIGKSFFLIRTKIDLDCMPRVGRSINEPETMKKIRQNCMVHVKDLISSEKEIFLISNYDKDKWDFDRLIEAITDALPILQRGCLTLSLSNITRECLKRKAKIFKAQAVAVAALSAATGAIPIPGVGGGIDVILIGGTIIFYYTQFGLNNITPEEQNLLKKNYRKIIQRYGFRQAADFTATIAPKTLGIIFGVEEVASFIPIIGIAIASSISFAFTLRYLLQAINELEETAIAVWDNAAKQDMGKSESKQVTQPTRKDGKIRFALLGGTGSGKSSFVNAIRGLDDYDEDAAQVGVTETTINPTEYQYPDNPNIIFVDLPGTGTLRHPDIPTYCKNVGLEDYDIFLLFTSTRFTRSELKLAEIVKSIGKSFLLIRTKIDVDCIRSGRLSNEAEILGRIRQTCMNRVKDLISSEKEIFLISNYDKDKWDFPRLVAAINAESPVPEGEWSAHSSSNITRGNLKRVAGSSSLRDTTSDLTEQYLADARTYVKQNGFSGIAEFLNKKLEGWKEVKMRFAITGDSGTGKSAFINAIRGLKDDDAGAAKLGVIETTRYPAEYEHPDNPKIRFVDLPAIGTPNFPDLPTYCAKIDLAAYDIFLIFTGGRFTQNDLELAEKVKSIGKSFFLIRTKIDLDCTPRFERSIIGQEILKKIRQNCMDDVKGLISSQKDIFLISNYDKDKWDFDCLIEAISGALHFLQRECLTLSLSNITRNCLKRKAEFFKAQAVAVAAVSACTGAIPIPGMTCVIDVRLIGGTMMAYYRQFGLNNITPEELILLDKTVLEIIERYQFRSAGELFAKFSSTSATKAVGVDEVSRFIPSIGTAIAGSRSFAMTLGYLTRSINEMKNAAFAVWDNAEKKSIKIHDSKNHLKKIINADGGVLKIDDIILKIGAGCLAKDTEVTMIKHDQHFAMKSLLDLDLVDADPRVVQFLPDGLKFLKPADLTIQVETMTVSNSELFILYGCYHCNYLKTVWKLVNFAIEDNRAERTVDIKINGFSFYSLIFAKRSKLARILSHFNHTFTCRAYALYRRLYSMDTIDISVVLLSEFVDENEEENIKQLKDHFEAGYMKGEKGMLKRVHTDRRLEMRLDFPGVESTPFPFKVDESELDKDGFVIDHFKRVKIKCPASGIVKISEKHGSAESEILWSCDVRENEQEIQMDDYYALSVESHRESEVSAESWKWEETSIIHREKFIKLREFGKTHPEEIKEVNGVRVCCSEEFLIGKGADGTRVYVGLGKDGYERAVKRLPRDACSGLAEQEKKILNELNIMKSNYTVRYWYLDEQSDKHYLFLILDLCEETLEHFVGHSSPDDLLRCAPLVIRQILKGLADLHRDPTPILHRDLKPTNIMRNVQGNWLLADFGISRILTRGASTHPSNQRGTEDWRAVESYPSKFMTNDGKARYKKESDIQVSGIVAFYIVTKGEHPFGSKPDRLRNLLDGKSVGLDTLKDPVLKDLLSWMLSLDPKDRPSAKEALKHPYLQHVKQQFKMLCQMGNQQEIKAGDWNSPVVQELNKDPTDWTTLMKPGVLKYLCAGFMNGRPKIFHYKSSWTECLRLIRNVNQHWHEQPRPLPQPEPFYEVGDPQEYFLNLFPNLPVEIHRIVRSCDWKERPDLKEYFI